MDGPTGRGIQEAEGGPNQCARARVSQRRGGMVSRHECQRGRHGGGPLPNAGRRGARDSWKAVSGGTARPARYS